MSKQDIEKRLGFAAQGVKVEMAAPKNAIQLPVNASEYAALVANDALNRTILGDSLYQITNQDRAIRAAGKAAAKSALARHDAWDKAWRNAPNDAARARVEAEAKKAESGMRKYLIDLYILRASRPGVKAKMALTISTVGAKNLCYEALANLKALAQLASETNSGWDFHVTVMTDHVKNAMSQLESSPAQAGRYLERAIDTLGMLKKIEPKRLNDIQKGSFKQLIGYVAKSLRDAKANIKVVTTASRPGAKAKMSATFIVSEAIFNAKNAVRRGDNENARRWIKAAQDAMDETVVSTGMRSKLEQLVKRYKMSRPGAKAKMGSSQVNDSATTADLIREAQRLRDVIKTSNREFDKTHLRQIKQELDRRGVLMPYGASEVLASRPGVKAKA